jgi:plasmid stabilization system protein ParE
LKVLLLPRALEDVEVAAAWYGAASDQVRAYFLADLDGAVGRIASFSESAPKVRGDIRRVLLGRFPFGVFYVITDAGIKVLAVFHLMQDEGRLGGLN